MYLIILTMDNCNKVTECQLWLMSDSSMRFPLRIYTNYLKTLNLIIHNCKYISVRPNRTVRPNVRQNPAELVRPNCSVTWPEVRVYQTCQKYVIFTWKHLFWQNYKLKFKISITNSCILNEQMIMVNSSYWYLKIWIFWVKMYPK